MSTTIWSGYHDDSALPIRKGDKVRIKKGDLIFRTGDGLLEAKRTYTVKVHHILPGMSYCVGWVDGKGDVHFSYTSSTDRVMVKKTYGTDDLAQLWPLMRANQSGSLFLPITNPEVVWPGTGGYWTSSDINQVERAAE